MKEPPRLSPIEMKETDPFVEFHRALAELYWTLIKVLRIPAIVDWLARVLPKRKDGGSDDRL